MLNAVSRVNGDPPLNNFCYIWLWFTPQINLPCSMSFSTILCSQNWVRWRSSAMYSEIDLLLLRFLLLNLNCLAIWFGFGFLCSPIKCFISAYELLPIPSGAPKLLNNLYVSEPQELNNATFFLLSSSIEFARKKNPYALFSYSNRFQA